MRWRAVALAAAMLALGGGQLSWAQTVVVTGDTDPSTSGSSSTWDLGNQMLSIGYKGQGSMSIQNGGQVANGSAYVGNTSSGIGSVRVQGAGSAWNINGSLNVGYYGTGEMLISNGAKVSSHKAEIGNLAGSTGRMLVTGSGTLWEMGKGALGLSVGSYGNGELTIKDGAKVVTSGDSLIGITDGAKGKVTVSGAGTQWIGSIGLSIGEFADSEGYLLIEDGAMVVMNNVVLGRTSTSKATLEIRSGGVLELSQLQDLAYSNSDNLILDGGTLRARRNIANFMARFGNVDLQAGGVNIDSNGFDIGVQTEFAGSGKLVKQGAGTLTLDGSSSYTGGTWVQGGTLLPTINTALGTGDVLIGNGNQSAVLRVNPGIDLANLMTVGNRGFLMGTGTVGATTVQAGGTVAAGVPGNITGTLTVNGDLNLGAGSTVAVHTNPNLGISNVVAVNGVANLDGRVLHIGAEEKFEAGTLYTILTATGGVNGKFAALEDYYAFLDLKAIYNANNVQLGWVRNQIDFSDLALTPNQLAVAKDVETHPTTGPIYSFVENLQDGQVPDALDSLSGEIHANILGRLENVSSKIATVGSRHLFSDLPAWVEVEGSWRNVKGDGNAAKLKQNTSGLYLGMNQDLGQSGWRVGGLLGYSRINAKSHARYASADIDNYSAALYAGKGFAHGANRVNVLGGLSYSHHSIDTDRSVPLLGQRLKTDYNAQTTQLFAELGYAMPWDAKTTIEPFAAVTVAKQRVDGFHESGGFAELSAASNSQTRTHMTLGVRGHSQVLLADKDVKLHATLGWRRGLGNMDTTRAMAFSGVGSEFTIAGVPLARNSALLGLQAQAQLSRNAQLELGYNGEFGGRSSAHAIQAKLSWLF
ncbi:autotransporter domain-containing protein [Comamonas sp. GB3 AK4-5]|uniref:autotransporter family protein n=1 Tax=Comamonas sp. GB3 AK4-5 TaxID=3231487 RepID=UPI00351E25DE